MVGIFGIVNENIISLTQGGNKGSLSDWKCSFCKRSSTQKYWRLWQQSVDVKDASSDQTNSLSVPGIVHERLSIFILHFFYLDVINPVIFDHLIDGKILAVKMLLR